MRTEQPESARAAAANAEPLIVDLTVSETRARAGRIAAGRERDGADARVLLHVEQDVRTRAEQAGFDRVMPRSRMACEGPALAEPLLQG